MSDAVPVPAAPPPRRRWLRVAAVLLALLAAVGGICAVAFSPALRWGAMATLSPSPDDAAWRAVPGGKPIVVAVDVRALLSSPVARALRSELEALARSQGMDLGLAERNARLIVITSDGRGFAHGAAAGPRLSPLMLPRFDPRWKAVEGAGAPAVGDGSAVIRPLDPGIVAFAVSEAGQDSMPALVAGLQEAATRPQDPLLLDGSALRITVTPDAFLKRRMTASVPRQAAVYAAAIERIDARMKAGDRIDAVVRLTMASDDAAGMASQALQQLSQVLSTGLVAFLVPFLGEDAAVLGKLPPFEVSRDGTDVVLTVAATPEQLRALLTEAVKER